MNPGLIFDATLLFLCVSMYLGTGWSLVLFSFPTSGNIRWPFMALAVVLLLIYYFAWARSRFMGPRVMGREEELTEIEREFEQAAKELESPAPA